MNRRLRRESRKILVFYRHKGFFKTDWNTEAGMLYEASEQYFLTLARFLRVTFRKCSSSAFSSFSNSSEKGRCCNCSTVSLSDLKLDKWSNAQDNYLYTVYRLVVHANSHWEQASGLLSPVTFFLTSNSLLHMYWHFADIRHHGKYHARPLPC